MVYSPLVQGETSGRYSSPAGQSTGASSNYEVLWALHELLVCQFTGASSNYEVHWALLELLVYYLCRLGLIAIVYELETLQVISPLPDGTY